MNLLKSNLFIGGDDSKLLKFDLRVGDKPIMTCRAHTAGVTSIHSSKEKEFLLATGRYNFHSSITHYKISSCNKF